MTISNIKKSALTNLKGNWKKAVLITLLYFTFSFALAYINRILKDFNSFVGLVISIFSLPFSYGLIISFIKLNRNEDVKVYDFFTLGLHNFTRAWKITGRILSKIWLPILLYIITLIGLVFLLYFKTITIALLSVNPNTLFFITFYIVLILFIAAFAYLLILSLKYSLCFYIAYDNETLSAKEVVENSDSLIKGYKRKYFLLQLSFIGWIILSIFTFYIGFLWLIPYIQIANICFYEYLKENKNNEMN